MKALGHLLEHDVFGQTARFERFTADLLFKIAAGIRIDPDKSSDFRHHVQEAFRNPFDIIVPQPYTAAEIKDYIITKAEAILNGLTETCRQD